MPATSKVQLPGRLGDRAAILVGTLLLAGTVISPAMPASAHARAVPAEQAASRCNARLGRYFCERYGVLNRHQTSRDVIPQRTRQVLPRAVRRFRKLTRQLRGNAAGSRIYLAPGKQQVCLVRVAAGFTATTCQARGRLNERGLWAVAACYPKQPDHSYLLTVLLPDTAIEAHIEAADGRMTTARVTRNLLSVQLDRDREGSRPVAVEWKPSESTVRRLELSVARSTETASCAD